MKLKKVVYPVRRWEIPSHSDVGVSYIVELLSDGSLIDNCMAGGMRKNCHHKNKVREYLKKYEPETYEKLKKPRQRIKRKD